MYNKKCKLCNKEIQGHLATKYCNSCAKISKLESKRNRAKRNKKVLSNNKTKNESNRTS